MLGAAGAACFAGAAHGEGGGRPVFAYYLHQCRVYRIRVDGGDPELLVDSPVPGGARSGINDGIAFDPLTGRIYWSNMGAAADRDGYIMSSDLRGRNVRMALGPGRAFTPKQLKIDPRSRKMYWSDREGMAVMRADLDGGSVETIVSCGDPDRDRNDQARWCVGLALDIDRGFVYWTQKGGDNAGEGVIRRAPIARVAGETPDRRSDIETLFSGLPEPIDLDLDLSSRKLYWTDRGDNTVSVAPMDPPDGADPGRRGDRRILVRGLKEAIGIALTPDRSRLAFTSLGGEIGVCDTDGGNLRMLAVDQGLLTGVLTIA
jgi:hypothetical protein